MKINLIYTGGLSKITNIGSEELEFEKLESLGDLLDELVHLYGEGFKNFVFPDGKDRFAIPILCNGKFSKSVTTLYEGDRIIFAFIVAGG